MIGCIDDSELSSNPKRLARVSISGQSIQHGTQPLRPGQVINVEVARVTIYRITDRLHEQHTADVPCSQIVTIVAGWLAELGVHSPLVEDLARAVCAGDWPTAYAIGDRLSVDVSVAA